VAQISVLLGTAGLKTLAASYPCSNERKGRPHNNFRRPFMLALASEPGKN